jgi:hypothetical protein
LCDSGVVNVLTELVSTPPSMPLRKLKSWKHSPEDVKVAFLINNGHWEIESSAPIEPVSRSEPAMLLDEHLHFYTSLLEWSFPKVSFFVFPSALRCMRRVHQLAVCRCQHLYEAQSWHPARSAEV